MGPQARLEIALKKARAAAERLAASGCQVIHLVGFSLGGLTCRVLASQPPPAGSAWERVVLIAPPNGGSAFGRGLSKLLPRFVWRVIWPGLLDVLPQACRDLPVPPPSVKVAIISGGRGAMRGYNPLLDGDNDFLVTLDETRLPGGCEDSITLRSTHGHMPTRRLVRDYAINFLQTGRLAPAQSA